MIKRYIQVNSINIMFNFIRKFYYWGISYDWVLAFLKNDIGSILAGDAIEYQLVKNPYGDRWFADPFILDVTENEYILLVEELLYTSKYARIAQLTIDKSTLEIKDSKPILELDSHLSFPAILRKGNNIYIYPESSQTGTLRLYQYDVKENSCERKQILCNQPLTDAVLFEMEGQEIILSTQLPYPNNQQLGIYMRHQNTGLFELQQEVIFKDNVARNAGTIISYNDKYFKTSQDCNVRYGGGLVVFEMLFDEGKWKFEEKVRIKSPSKRYDLGIHTLNCHKGVYVVDLLGYRHPFVGHILLFLKRTYFYLFRNRKHNI